MQLPGTKRQEKKREPNQTKKKPIEIEKRRRLVDNDPLSKTRRGKSQLNDWKERKRK